MGKKINRCSSFSVLTEEFIIDKKYCSENLPCPLFALRASLRLREPHGSERSPMGWRPKRGKERENFAKEGNSFLLMFPLHPIPLSLYHSRNKKSIHLIFWGEGFEILVLDKCVVFFWKDFIDSIQLKFRMSL